MSDWVDRVKNHPVVNKISTILNEIEKAESSVGDNSKAVESLDRVRTVISQAKSRIDATDPILIPMQALQNLDNAMNGVLQEIRNYASTKNIAYLTNASTNCDNVLLQMQLSPTLDGTLNVEGLRDAISAFRKSATQQMRIVEEQSAKLQNGMKTITERMEASEKTIEAQKGRLDTAIAEFQKQFSAAEQTRSEQFANAQTKLKELFEKAQSDRVSTTEKRQAFWEDKFAQLLSKEAKDTDAFQVEIRQAHELWIAESRASASKLMDALDADRVEAEKLVGLIANTGMATGFQRVADAEGKRASRWQLAAGTSMVGLIGFAVWAFYETIGQRFDWGTIGTRIFVALAFGLASVYAAKQASWHRNNEKASRKLELILLSVNPYLTDLPADEQHKLKAKLAELIFVPEQGEVDSKDSVQATNLFDLLKVAVDNLTKLRK